MQNVYYTSGWHTLSTDDYFSEAERFVFKATPNTKIIENNFLDDIVTYCYLRVAAGKLHKFNKIISEMLSNFDSKVGSKSESELLENYTAVKSFLDEITESPEYKYVNKIEPHWTLRPLASPLKKMLELFKQFELKLRLKLYPGKNKHPLSYDEMKELLKSFEKFTAAEEESDAYND